MLKTVVPLILLIVTAQAEERREPSLFLEYERELKKANDSFQEDENAFIKASPIRVKNTVRSEPPPKEVTIKESTVLKNTKVETETIGQDSNPFLVVPAPIKPPPSEEVHVAQSPEKIPEKIIRNVRSVKEELLSRAKDFLGTPYGFGNNGSTTDCSGFTQQVYQSFGVNLPRSASEQAMLGETVALNNLEVGDLLFYRTYKSDPSHVAIYAGDGKIIHASYAAKRVQYDSIYKEYYKNRFLYAKRLSVKDPKRME